MITHIFTSHNFSGSYAPARTHRLVRGLAGLILCALLSLFVTACANIGNPSGGPRDEDPPLFVSADPGQGALNVNRTRMTLTFNELVNVKDAFSKVVVSPVGKSVPKVTSLGRKVTVQFDSLQPDMTYTIDFADAIEDNNEGNKLTNFAYTFSTGSRLDSLRISGMVLGARNLEPQQGMLVGVTQNLSDSAFTKLPLLRVAKTDDRGRFSIRGLAEGKYRVFALGDRDNDYTYANPEEDLAFYDFIVEPSSRREGVVDTVYNKLTGVVDSVVDRTRTVFLPNDILLRSFNSEKRPQYLSKYERPDSTRLFIKFNTRADYLPLLDALGFPGLMRDAIVETRKGNDSIFYWLPEPLMREDSLRVETRYLRTDSTGRLAAVTDTLRFFTPHRKVEKASKKKVISAQDSIKALLLDWKVTSPSSLDVYAPLEIEFDTPLARLNPEAFTLEMQVDTLWRRVPNAPKPVLTDSLLPRNYSIQYPWEYGQKYRLRVDTLAATGIYGKPTGPLVHEFTAKKKDEYCSWTCRISGLEPDIPAFVELLNGSDVAVRAEVVRDGMVQFTHLTPGKYYARLYEDYNGNGEYDPGDYATGLQPDLAYYYPKAINLKKNWDKSDDWDVFATSIEQQKPQAILKNRPATDSRNRKKQNVEEEDEEDDYFDPTANPFDPNQKRQRNNNAGYRY